MYKTLYFRKDDGSKAGRYFIFDTQAELLTSTLVLGDIAFAVDTKTFFVATSSNAWTQVGGGSPSTASNLVIDGGPSDATYLSDQFLDGGQANSTYISSQYVSGGAA